jgi:hypothetical protein
MYSHKKYTKRFEYFFPKPQQKTIVEQLTFTVVAVGSTLLGRCYSTILQ